MGIDRANGSAGPTSLQEEARLSGEFTDWNNLVLGTAWLTGELDVALVRDAWRRVCLRHDALRRTYVAPDEARTFADPLSEVEFHDAGTDAEAIELMRGILGVPFNLSGPGFSRVAVVRTGERRHLLGVVLDHIITDEISWLQMMSDFTEFYRRGLEGADGDIADAGTYQAFASAQRREFDGVWGDERKAFWRFYITEFGTIVPEFSVRRRAGGAPDQKVLSHDLPPDAWPRVNDFAQRARVTRYAVVAASLLAAMRNIGDDPAVGLVTVGHGRVLPGTSRTVGLFVQTVPLHLTRRTTDPLEAVREVFGRSLDVFEYGVPPLVAGRRWRETLVSPDAKPGVQLHLYDGDALAAVGAFAGTSVERVRLDVPGGVRDWEDTVIVSCHLGGANPRFTATYNEDRYPGDVVGELLRNAAAALVG